MLKTHNLFFIVFFLIVAGGISRVSYAQRSSNSPYSRYGLGDLHTAGFGESPALGNIGIGWRTKNQINYLNPAAYSSQDTMTFLFDAGLTGGYTNYKSNELEVSRYNMQIDHLAISFPITKWWATSIGLLPYSSVGYNILEQSNVIINNNGEDRSVLTDYIYEGSGGLNRIYLGTGIKLGKHVSAGVNASYIFGAQNINSITQLPFEKNHAQLVVERDLIINDFIITSGIQAFTPLGNNIELTVGATIDLETNLTAYESVFSRTIMPVENGVITDTIQNYDSEETDITIPLKYGVGFSLSYKNMMRFGFDYTQQDWSKTTLIGSSDPLAASQSVHFGAEYIPDVTSVRRYIDRVRFRAGAHYADTYLQIKDEQLKDYGISFGLGLPMKGNNTMFNIGFLLGKRGTLDQGLIEETYGKVSLNITFSDFWFFQRRID